MLGCARSGRISVRDGLDAHALSYCTAGEEEQGRDCVADAAGGGREEEALRSVATVSDVLMYSTCTR
jgi:hypothetical protein